jgi:hypothetical protein
MFGKSMRTKQTPTPINGNSDRPRASLCFRHRNDGPFTVRPFTDRGLAPWWTQDSSVQSPVRPKARGKVDIEDRRHRRGACYPMLSGRSELASTDRQARYVPGSVEGIRGAWSGLAWITTTVIIHPFGRT